MGDEIPFMQSGIFFFAILGKGPWAFQIGKISGVKSPKFGNLL